jgi:putative lipoprotein (rSAM/lipoprotein system)
MKTLKKNWLFFFNRLLSLALTILGFNSCGCKNACDCGNGGMLMYGMPPAKYDIKANVRDTDDKPIQGIRVSIKAEEYNNNVMRYGLTDKNGVFACEVYQGRVNVVCEDIDSRENGLFESDSIQDDISTKDDFRLEFTIRLKPKE